MKNCRRILLSVAFAIFAMLAAACSHDDAKNEKPVVVVHCLHLSEDFQLAIERQCPDIEIKWFLSLHSHENLFNNIEEIPDILCMSSFYADKQPESYLKDISGEINIANYSRGVIENFMEDNGAVYWVPAIGYAYFILANKALFRKYGVQMPHDYNSLVAADKAFKSHGVDGLSWGLSEGWSFSAILAAQCLCADIFNSYDCMLWRSNLKKSGPNGDYTLDDELWPEVFRRLKSAYDSGLIDETDFRESLVTTSDKMRFGQSAMALTSSNNLSGYDSDKYAVIPFFDSTGNPWAPIYMGMSFAVSNQVSDEKLPYVMKVLEAILGPQSLKAYNESRGGAFPMDKNVDHLPESMAPLKNVIEDGFSFLLFNEWSSGIVKGVYKAASEMSMQDLDPEEAYERAKKYIIEYRSENAVSGSGVNTDDPEHLIFTSDVSYPHRTDSNFNNPAASCITNTAFDSVNHLSETKFDIMLTLPHIIGAPIEAKPYCYDKSGKISMESDFFYLFSARRGFYPATMTVAELIQYLNNSFYYFHRIDDGLPVMAGASYVVDKYDDGIPDADLPFTPGTVNAGKIANSANFPTRYICRAIIKDGRELGPDETLEVLVGRENVFYMTEHSDLWESSWVGFRPMLRLPDSDGKVLMSCQDFFLEHVLRDGKACEPTRYLYINEINAE